MKLFLCSHFSEVGELIREDVFGKTVAFIPTASINEEYRGYVYDALNLWEKMGVNIINIDISTENIDEITKVFEISDIIYFTGGNSFFLIDWIRKKGVDKLLKKHLNEGKLYIGESGGAIVCASDISYIIDMDEIPEDYSQSDNSGLNFIDFYVVPHYKCEPFIESADKIVRNFSHLDICAIKNSEAIVVKDNIKDIISI